MDSGQIVACPLTSREAKGPASDATSGNLVTHALTREGHDASEDGTGGGVPLVVVKATKSHGPDEYERWEGADTALTLDAAGHSPRTATAVFSVSPESGQGASLSARQVKAGEPAPTLNGTDEAARTNRGARIVDAVGVRRLTPRECERLQGFPDDWTRYDPIDRELADSPRYRMLGNAVAVPIAEWIGRRIVSVGGPGRQSRRPG